MIADVDEISPAYINGVECRRFRVGSKRFPTRKVRVWRRAVLKDHRGNEVTATVGKGKDSRTVRAFYLVKDLPVGPRINGGEGFRLVNGQPTYSTEFWQRFGWQPIEALPDGWQRSNEALLAEKARRAREEYEATNMGRLEVALRAQNRTVESLVQSLTVAAPEGSS